MRDAVISHTNDQHVCADRRRGTAGLPDGGPADAPPLLFINSLGTDRRMWEPQVAVLAGPFRTIRYDARGHGRSDVPPAPTRWSVSGGMRWPCWTAWASRGRTSAGFRARDAATTERIRLMVSVSPPNGYIGACAALRDADVRHLLSTIDAPSLVIGGELDESTPPIQGEDVHGAIVSSTLIVIPGVAHLSNIEAPDLFNRRVLEHLTAE